MATHASGRIPEFNGSSWTSWFGRLQFYFEANSITDSSKKRAHLLTLCGEQTYDTVCALVQPSNPAEVAYDDIVAALQKHYDPRPAEVFSRARFQRRNQLEGETVSAYVAALKTLAADCNFGTLRQTQAAAAAATGQQTTTTPPSNATMLPLDIMLGDRFVCGLRDDLLQQRLFAESDPTFTKAYDIAVRAESASQQQRDMRGTIEPVHHQRLTEVITTSPQTCKFQAAMCNFCNKRGHIEKACISKKKLAKGPPQRHKSGNAPRSITQVETQHSLPAPTSLYDLHNVNLGTQPKIMVTLAVNRQPIEFEVDSGAACTLISEETYRNTWPRNAPPLLNEDTHLRTWSGQDLPILGSANVEVAYNGTLTKLPIVIVKGTGSSLLGRNWFHALNIAICGINQAAEGSSTERQELVERLKKKYGTVFSEEISGHNGPPVDLELHPEARPKFLKARSIPFALQPAYEKELDKLEQQGIIAPTQHSDWATPLVAVRKKNGSLRLCGDYRFTVNLATKSSSYPLPTPQEVFSTLRRGKIFSTLDLTQAYQQLKVSDKTSEVLTLNTTRGLYRVKRLPFGIAAAPAIFQRYMESQLQGIPGVCVYLDDVIISGATSEDHDTRLELVLKRLASANLRLSIDKCCFAVPEVKFLGHLIDAEGIHPTSDKVRAITEARAPTSKQELQSFLGLLTFYDRFLEHRATVANDLYNLLKNDVPWTWSPRHQEAFEALKELLRDSVVLRHYDETKPLLLACDASPYGVGAVLSQIDDQGREAAIAFASRTLSPAERNYSQLDREGLAVVYGATHFHQYIAGRHVTVLTDHRPLLGILGPQKQIPQTLSPRMIRWCIKMSAYDYDLVYRPGNKHQNADALSRLPLSETIEDPPQVGCVLMLEALPKPPLTADEVATATQDDPTLSKLYKALQAGSVQKLKDENFNAFRKRATELSCHRGCITLGSRVVIPGPLRQQATALIHAGHRGVVAMKKCARSYMWWPGIDKDIETLAAECTACQSNQRAPPRAPVPDWDRPNTPWHTVHLDFAGPIDGSTFLVIVDAYSKWFEVRLMNKTTSTAVIEALRSLFATFGLPHKVVSDNGTAFVSAEIQKFYSDNGITAVTSAPYHPATNGQAERYVGELKRALARDSTGPLQRRIARFLFKQHTTVQNTTGQTPAKLVFSPAHAAVLPEPPSSVNRDNEDAPRCRKFHEGQAVLARQFHRKPEWVLAIVKKRIGLRSWLVEVNGTVSRRHLNQLRHVNVHYSPGGHAQGSSPPAPFNAAWLLTKEQDVSERTLPAHPAASGEKTSSCAPAHTAPAQRQSTRQRRPPDRYQAQN
ncbi:uncharacterized protein K02A2.6-like [Rhipicephalus sanguineus]|uniref:uncharacterized protein K02A2.6-like n=1 Tax=Rhipicephalus sanguineus TaxID=34632 RepID=UPI0020C3D411|nr:uncharacterized protein K02A2.6-like [Rhipicephalus sanguineus]